MHGTNAPPSTLQAVETASAPVVKSIETEPTATVPGAPVTWVTGGVVSTVTVTPALGADASPPASMATTVYRQAPSGAVVSVKLVSGVVPASVVSRYTR